MRWLARVSALLIAVSLGGCTLLELEKNNRGGVLDAAADDIFMKADSKKMRALRALALEASLARIAMIAPKSAPDRSLLARRIGETSRRADVVRRCAFLQLQVTGQRSDEPCFFFDSVMVDYENALFDLALIALPIEEARNLITKVSGGVASVTVNPLLLVQALLDVGREAFRYGRVVGAMYRDTLELEVQVWLASPEFAAGEIQRGVPVELVVTDDKVAALRAAYARGNDNIPAWRAEITALRAQGLEPVPDHRFITEIFAIITYICGQIVNERDPSFAECTQSNLLKNIPVASGPGGSIFRVSVTTPGGAGGGIRPSRPADVEEIQRLRDQVRKLTSEQRLAVNQIERNMSAFDLQSYKKALCVAGPDDATDRFDQQTRDRLREFVSGVGWVPAITQSTAPVQVDRSVEDNLKKAIAISPSCTAPNAVARNAYELGIYSRSGIAAVDNEMMHALKGLRLNDALKGRDAIGALQKAFAPQSPPANGAQLSPELWAFILSESVKEKRSSAPAIPPSPPSR